MNTNRRKLRGVVDTGNLSAQIVLFLSEVERVGNNITLEVTSETDLDLTGSFEALRIQIGKTGPGALRLV